MKFLLIIALFIGSQTFAQSLCSDPLQQSDVCFRMQHLRAQITQLDAQRELMNVNYDYLKAIGTNMRDTAKDIITRLGPNNEHAQGLKAVESQANWVASMAEISDSTALVYANSIRTNCISCHNNSKAPPGGVSWDQIFNADWDSISKKCNEPGKNPYLCKNMNGVLSAYGFFSTAQNANAQNYELSKLSADEIVRVLALLKKNNILHVPENLRSKAENAAKEVSRLAAKRDPATFDKAQLLPQSCMGCHEANIH